MRNTNITHPIQAKALSFSRSLSLYLNPNYCFLLEYNSRYSKYNSPPYTHQSKSTSKLSVTFSRKSLLRFRLVVVRNKALALDRIDHVVVALLQERCPLRQRQVPPSIRVQGFFFFPGSPLIYFLLLLIGSESWNSIIVRSIG